MLPAFSRMLIDCHAGSASSTKCSDTEQQQEDKYGVCLQTTKPVHEGRWVAHPCSQCDSSPICPTPRFTPLTSSHIRRENEKKATSRRVKEESRGCEMQGRQRAFHGIATDVVSPGDARLRRAVSNLLTCFLINTQPNNLKSPVLRQMHLLRRMSLPRL
ncbi:hypothetical protein E2C01_051039 [Portunus trituberculatus]|uniref:Uncharacterized protein n=1 Tax=Portunus trituberculatus TaxID=210409 RepID=A0A5B7GIH4_PORTR|nr:hypothetical protein [Portunus trituberculatus]